MVAAGFAAGLAEGLNELANKLERSKERSQQAALQMKFHEEQMKMNLFQMNFGNRKEPGILKSGQMLAMNPMGKGLDLVAAPEEAVNAFQQYHTGLQEEEINSVAGALEGLGITGEKPQTLPPGFIGPPAMIPASKDIARGLAAGGPGGAAIGNIISVKASQEKALTLEAVKEKNRADELYEKLQNAITLAQAKGEITAETKKDLAALQHEYDKALTNLKDTHTKENAKTEFEGKLILSAQRGKLSEEDIDKMAASSDAQVAFQMENGLRTSKNLPPYKTFAAYVKGKRQEAVDAGLIDNPVVTPPGGNAGAIVAPPVKKPKKPLSEIQKETGG